MNPVRVALRALGANKLRTTLTMLGIIIGVSAVIALMSIGRGAQAQVTAQIQSLGTNLLFIRPGAARDQGVRSGAGTAPTLTLDDSDAIALLPNVVAAAPDAILITEKSFERAGGADGVVKFPGVALTPAGKNRNFVPVSDMYFQGFGPGVGKAVKELALKLHPELKP